MLRKLFPVVIAVAFLSGCKIKAPSDSCTDPLQLALDPTRNSNVFEIDLCGLQTNDDCIRRRVEIYVDDTLRGLFTHGNDIELASDPLEYVVYARDGSCISPPVRILVP